MTSRFRRQEWALVVVAFLWGGSFLGVRQAMRLSGPLFFVGVRFLVAAVALAVVDLRALRGVTRREGWAGGVVGLSIFLGYALQTEGLRTISSSKSAFITSFYVPMVPLLAWPFLGRGPGRSGWIGIGLAVVGLILLAGPDAWSFGLGRGEVLTLASTLAIAAEVLLISRFANMVDPRRATVLQLAATSFLALALIPLTGEAPPRFSWPLLALTLGMGLATAFIQLTMNWAQKTVSPTRATLIYASEPAWAALVGRLAGEPLPPLSLLGATLLATATLLGDPPPNPAPEPDFTPPETGSA